jgi:hypothetical protein
MFSKAIALLLLAASAFAGQMAEGTYRITNVGSHTTARVYSDGAPIYVSSDRSNPGPFELVSPSLIIFFEYTITDLLQTSGLSKVLTKMVTLSKTLA